MTQELLKQALDALENSSDFVFKDTSKSYLRELAINTLRTAIAQPEHPEHPEHPEKSAAYVQKVIDSLYENSDPVSVEAAELLETIAQPVPHDLSERLADLHLYEEIAEYYAKCSVSPEALQDWVIEHSPAPACLEPPAVSDDDENEVIVVQPTPTSALLVKADKIASALRGSRVNYAVEQDAAATIWELIDVIRAQPPQPDVIDAVEQAIAALNAAAFAHPSAGDQIGSQCCEAATRLRAASVVSKPTNCDHELVTSLRPDVVRGAWCHKCGQTQRALADTETNKC